MKITKKMCAELGIFNPHIYANGEPYLDYHPQETGRAYRFARWSVTKAGEVLSDHWRDYGAKTFSVYERGEKQRKFNEAYIWMTRRFGLTELARTPMGSWMEKSLVEKRNKEIEQLYKSKIAGA